MIRIRFDDFRKGNYSEEGYWLYILRDTDHVLYVGMSSDGVWHRWFGGGWSHMMRNVYGDLIWNSPAGRKVYENEPASWDWTIELWTAEDCLNFAKRYFPKPENIGIRRMVKEVESLLIHQLEPDLNACH